MMNVATQQFVAAHLHDDVRRLAFGVAPHDVDLKYALQQIAARQILATKVPSWAENPLLEFPPHLSVEQCSSELTAGYKSTLLSGKNLVDLTGGMGVDSFFLSKRFEHTDYVECQAHLADLAQRNFAAMAANIAVHHASAEQYLQQMSPVDAIYIDPARRDTTGRKVVSIADCTPDVARLQTDLTAKAKQVLIKLSPMLDITQAINCINHIREVHVVAVANECKELLLLLERDFDREPEIVCANIAHATAEMFRFRYSDEKNAQPVYATTIDSYLYEPNATVMKAGAFSLVAERYHLQKLHPSSHLYTSNRVVTHFPGRLFRVVSWHPFNKKLRGMWSKANVSTRNFPLSVPEIRRVLKIADGGNIYLFATTLSDGTKAVVQCVKVAAESD